VRRLHVIPVNDHDLHNAQSSCWCHPTEVQAHLFAHNAKDCRESRERMTGKGCPLSEWVIVGEEIIEHDHRYAQGELGRAPFNS
jgi:hypothetical protein